MYGNVGVGDWFSESSYRIDEFEKIRTRYFYYADKCLFIKKLLQNRGEVNLFTCPRHFGKTLTINMLTQSQRSILSLTISTPAAEIIQINLHIPGRFLHTILWLSF